MSVLSLRRRRGLLDRLHAASWRTLLELAVRAGYGARGFVYVTLGAIALLAALGQTPEAEGATGSLQAWGKWPLGVALLWLTGVGLYAFAGWRALQSVFDADRQGYRPKAIASRIGQAISGVLYAGLGVSIFGLLDAVEDLSETDDQVATSEKVSGLLALPHGDWVVIAVGAFVLACGIGNIVRGLVERFARDLDCDHEHRRWLGVMARVGYVARGVAFLPAGLFTVSAGLNARASDAKGLGGALELLKDQPFGSVVLACIALGLIAFGLFAFVEARYRPIRAAEAIEKAAS